MTRIAFQGLLMVAGFVVLLVGATVAVVEPGRQGVWGAAVGAGLGLVNLAVGYLVMRRALRRGMKSAMATLAAGFLARLPIVVGLMLIFRRYDTIDETAFALTFLVFFFINVGVELLLVERSLNRSRRPERRTSSGRS